MKLLKILLALPLIIATNSFAQETSRPDYHAPIGVMRDHVHDKGEIMLSYRIAYMKMKELRNGDDRISSNEALNDYMVVPTEMTVRAEMLGAMYGVTDNFTLSGMIGFVDKRMNLINRNGQTIKRASDGLTDSKINAMYKFYDHNNSKVQFNLGLSLPTGSISQSNNGTRMPYPMQIGSGSYELLPGFSYTKLHDDFSYGAQVNATFRLNSNHYDYKLGDSYNATLWLAEKLNHSFSISARLNYNKIEDIKGYDEAVVGRVNMVTTADTSLQAKEQLDLSVGANYIINNGYLKGHRLALELARPIYQRIDGPMLENDYKIIAGWQKTF